MHYGCARSGCLAPGVWQPTLVVGDDEFSILSVHYCTKHRHAPRVPEWLTTNLQAALRRVYDVDPVHTLMHARLRFTFVSLS